MNKEKPDDDPEYEMIYQITKVISNAIKECLDEKFITTKDDFDRFMIKTAVRIVDIVRERDERYPDEGALLSIGKDDYYRQKGS